MLAVESKRSALPRPPELFSPKVAPALQQQGNSVSGFFTLNGNLVAIHGTALARSGQILAARLSDEVTMA